MGSASLHEGVVAADRKLVPQAEIELQRRRIGGRAADHAVRTLNIGDRLSAYSRLAICRDPSAARGLFAKIAGELVCSLWFPGSPAPPPSSSEAITAINDVSHTAHSG